MWDCEKPHFQVSLAIDYGKIVDYIWLIWHIGVLVDLALEHKTVIDEQIAMFEL